MSIISPSEPVRAHAAQRALERYGLTLSYKDLNELAARCARREGLVGRDPDGAAYHDLIFNDQMLRVLYRHPVGCAQGFVVTILPKNSSLIRSGRDHRLWG